MPSGKSEKFESVRRAILGFFTAGRAAEYELETLRRVIMINIISLVGVLFLLLLGSVAVAQANTVVAIADYIVACILLGNVLFLRRTQNYRFASCFGISMTAMLFVYLFMKGESNNTAHLWYYTFPLFAAFLLGARGGALASLLILLAPVILFTMPELPPFFARYSLDFKIRFLPSYFVVFLFSYTFEKIRERTQAEYVQKNEELSVQTSELAQVNRKLRREIVQRKRSERKSHEAREEAELANRAKSTFLANMSHELRTPLNHIIGFTELLLDREVGTLNDTQRDYLTDVRASSVHLLALINDILDLSKVEAGKLELKVSKIELQPLLHDSFNVVRQKALKHSIELDSDIDVPEVFLADERKLRQILFNLLSNAVKFTPDGGKVTLSARVERNGVSGELGKDGPNRTLYSEEEADCLHISVRDTGIGLEEKDMDRVFQPFEQAENHISRQFPGTGLGLPITKKLVELHGGRVWAVSEGIGKGSTFHVTIPAAGRG
jgi:signal transduction histidine kinase